MQAKEVFYSRILNGGGLVHHERLEVSEEHIRYERRSRINHHSYSVSIPLRSIIAMEIYPRMYGVNVIIKTKERTITCRGLSRKRATKIKALIENRA
ncbi:MAG: hypothetical protein K9J27_01945 [Bacteroidales bacterium]|nr:hypothetical protein [Bacteroidales bacterium]MCF8332599.1 hypothetical protein [Bacteroidales bacterium]